MPEKMGHMILVECLPTCVGHGSAAKASSGGWLDLKLLRPHSSHPIRNLLKMAQKITCMIKFEALGLSAR